ncbi:nucleotidyl transferase AbiEii/AbiGii toxin family protein [Kitasatospora sp. NPDC048540]|uniref:nucleotidyl transferase AbiEii/AbiGii toxin family protein n=1 Tax=Kitasatospora sp. NPDC048540 TaxID=3155634 RepID=UPI0033E25C9A
MAGTGDGWRGAGPAGAHRAVLDHVLALMADLAWEQGLVLRGSMCLTAWAPGLAREPADLDWIVPSPAGFPVDLQDPHPYLAGPEAVQQWPEAFDGAARYEIWRTEEFGTAGLHAAFPPEGLHWLAEDEDHPDFGDLFDPAAALTALVRAAPQVAPGLVLDPDGLRVDGGWTYRRYDTPGVRLVVPWRADGLPPGEVRLDFARDEWLPQAPVLTAVPRADGGRPTAVRTASRELSLAWKLCWLHGDAAGEGTPRGKDLYDAVLLAEHPATRLTARLVRTVLRRSGTCGAGDGDGFDVREVCRRVDRAAFAREHPWVRGSAEEWVRRLAGALEPVLGAGGRVQPTRQGISRSSLR